MSVLKGIQKFVVAAVVSDDVGSFIPGKVAHTTSIVKGYITTKPMIVLVSEFHFRAIVCSGEPAQVTVHVRSSCVIFLCEVCPHEKRRSFLKPIRRPVEVVALQHRRACSLSSQHTDASVFFLDTPRLVAGRRRRIGGGIGRVRVGRGRRGAAAGQRAAFHRNGRGSEEVNQRWEQEIRPPSGLLTN